MIIGIDQDDMALEVASARLTEQFPELAFLPLKGNFANLDELLLQAKVPGIDAILFDLGVSSPQLDLPERGFSYSKEAPLDMRMDPGTRTLTAAEIINTKTEADLTWILRTYGEERWASRIAYFIIMQRARAPIATTTELADLVKNAIPASARRVGGNPAKRTFQALRIAVNDELAVIEKGLDAAARWLNPGGRLAVLTYHSLEDRIVKGFMRRMVDRCTCPPDAPICVCGKKPVFTRVSKKPLVPTGEEIEANPRSASAKLRVAIK
jgi:16S rRNA (cytosine1402-N4)-methyltransferase